MNNDGTNMTRLAELRLVLAEARYQDYVKRFKSKPGGPQKPMPKDEWEAKVLGKKPKDEGTKDEGKKDERKPSAEAKRRLDTSGMHQIPALKDAITGGWGIDKALMMPNMAKIDGTGGPAKYQGHPGYAKAKETWTTPGELSQEESKLEKLWDSVASKRKGASPEDLPKVEAFLKHIKGTARMLNFIYQETMRDQFKKDQGKKDDKKEPEKKEPEKKDEPKKNDEPKKSYSKKYNKTVTSVMDKHNLTDDDADAVKKWKGDKPFHGEKISDAEKLRRFLAKAKPETKERMKGMSPAEFVKILGAIMDDEGAEGGGKTASTPRFANTADMRRAANQVGHPPPVMP